jgi:hypothetical protein
MAPALLRLLCASFSSGGFGFLVAAVVGVFLGIYLFWSGFRKLRFKRLILCGRRKLSCPASECFVYRTSEAHP